MNASFYTPTQIKKEAHQIARERGRYIRHAIRVHGGGASLVVFYVQRGHPCFMQPLPPESAILDYTYAL